MKKIVIKELDKKRFDAFVQTSRSTILEYIGKEISWYSNEDESIIGVVVLDKTDNDYASIMLGRDEVGRFRAFNLQVNFPYSTVAEEWLFNTIKWYTGLAKKVFPQGDPKKSYELFKTRIPIEKQHPYFIKLNRSDAFLPAKELIVNIMPYFIDIDGNFIEQFQTTGFDSRLWELYLYSFFIEAGFNFDRRYDSPDFIINKFNEELAVEAVIVGRTDSKPRYLNLPEDFLNRAQSVKDMDEMAIRFGSPLFTKLNKKYWELEQVEGLPLILAIADFHDDQSMLWSSTYLINYLYGYTHEFHYDDSGQLIIKPKKIKTHKHNKEIPSGFFFQPNTDRISAVLFSASATISKFNRLGRQAGFGGDKIKMLRYGMYHNHDPNASVPKPFKYEVTEESGETWGEGLSLFHNPNAKIPVPECLFPNIAHHRFNSGNIVSLLPEFHPYGSVTLNMIIRED